MSEPFANVGDYVMASYGWPHMGNASGSAVEICKVTKITKTGKFRLKRLPSRRENDRMLDRHIRRWDKIITSREPIEERGVLTDAEGYGKRGRIFLVFEVIPESRLDLPFEEKYDYYN